MRKPTKNRVVDGLVRAGIGAAVMLGFASALGSAQAIQVPPPGGDGVFRAGMVSFVLPSPAPNLVEMGPDLRVMMEIAAPTSNRLVAAFIPPEDLAKLPGGLADTPRNYGLVEVLRRAEFVDVDEATFKQVVDGMSQQMNSGEMQSAMLKQQDKINEKIDELGLKTGKVTLDKPQQLGSIFSKPNAFGFAMVMPMASNGKSVNMVSGTALLRVKNRMIYAYLYTQYQDKSSVDWIVKTTESWADAILKANP